MTSSWTGRVPGEGECRLLFLCNQTARNDTQTAGDFIARITQHTGYTAFCESLAPVFFSLRL